MFFNTKGRKPAQKIWKPMKNCYDLTQRVRIKRPRCYGTLPYPSLPVPLESQWRVCWFGHKDSCTAKFHLKNRMNVSWVFIHFE